jgi:hypothetical protein
VARKIVWFVAIALLLITGALGIYNGLNEWRGAGTTLQKSVTASVFIYGLLGITGATGMIARQRWSVWVVMAWAVAITWAAGVSVIAYGGKDVTALTAIAAGISAAIIALVVIWGARTGFAPATKPPGTLRS